MQVPEIVVGIIIGIAIVLGLGVCVGWFYFAREFFRTNAIICLAGAVFGIPAINIAVEKMGFQFELNQDAGSVAPAIVAILALSFLEWQQKDHKYTVETFLLIQDHYQDGRPIDEIAELYNVPKKRLLKALRFLGRS